LFKFLQGTDIALNNFHFDTFRKVMMNYTALLYVDHGLDRRAVKTDKPTETPCRPGVTLSAEDMEFLPRLLPTYRLTPVNEGTDFESCQSTLSSRQGKYRKRSIMYLIFLS